MRDIFPGIFLRAATDVIRMVPIFLRANAADHAIVPNPTSKTGSDLD